jgi:hypothetical protein
MVRKVAVVKIRPGAVQASIRAAKKICNIEHGSCS